MAKMPLCHFSVALFLILAMGRPGRGIDDLSAGR